ncbi:ubiquitin carboxyl-terminal hydrolase 7 [Nematocida displodere]|uniref:Ubiquitin carboxyl-terminal hydrolase 7 n=1 Tax=Nematocida displodere TaxID=1805483 RepID=A0A177EDE1_9MICR|nr:ubiquitin carboxyl-terminal hydrolase 7 [Nematocida displodere]
MSGACYNWDVEHRFGDKNQFGEYFTSHNFNWRLVMVSADRHLVFLEYFGYLPFEVFTTYTLHIKYEDGEEEEKEVIFAFDNYQSDFGTEISPKKTVNVRLEIKTAIRCYESPNDTPYAGMINLGSTCYLNSLTQTLFHIKGFERELFKQKPEGKTLEMQKLFYQMERETTYVDTLDFVKVFKLKESIDDQQDIQEFCKSLLDDLEKEAKGTPFFAYLEDTFYGSTASLIECEKGCKREITEKYNDIQLGVRSPFQQSTVETFEDALLEYINTTQLEEPNLYNCEKHGYVKATKKDYFKTFPPVLFFQLKRFNMNYETGHVYKVNDYFSFPDKIDLSPYTLEKGQKNVYSIYSVNVHHGDGMGEGHYYAYVRKGREWYKFNDCYVTKSSKSEAIRGTYGGRHEYKNKFNIANAYFLVYIKEEMEEELLNGQADFVPEVVKDLIERNMFMTEFAVISIYTPETVKGFWGLGALSLTNQYMCKGPVQTRLERAHTLNQLKARAKKALGLHTPGLDNVYLYSVTEEGAFSLLDEDAIKTIAHLPTTTIFAIEATGEIPREKSTLLFVKTEKAVEQPYDLKVVASVRDVYLVNREEKVSKWLDKYCNHLPTALLEKNGQVLEVDRDKTFSEIFEEDMPIIVLNSGKESLSEYFSEVSNYKIVTATVDEQIAVLLWVPRQWDGENLAKLLAEELRSEMFEVTCADEAAIAVTTKPGFVAVKCAFFGEETGNPNEVKMQTLIVPKTIQGSELIALVQKPDLAPKAKLKIIEAYAGKETVTVYRATEMVSPKPGAALTIQTISKKSYAEAAVKCEGVVVGYPFLINAGRKRSVMETKRKYVNGESLLVRVSPKKQTSLSDADTVKKICSSDKFIFTIHCLPKS